MCWEGTCSKSPYHHPDQDSSLVNLYFSKKTEGDLKSRRGQSEDHRKRFVERSPLVYGCRCGAVVHFPESLALHRRPIVGCYVWNCGRCWHGDRVAAGRSKYKSSSLPLTLTSTASSFPSSAVVTKVLPPHSTMMGVRATAVMTTTSIRDIPRTSTGIPTTTLLLSFEEQ